MFKWHSTLMRYMGEMICVAAGSLCTWLIMTVWFDRVEVPADTETLKRWYEARLDKASERESFLEAELERAMADAKKACGDRCCKESAKEANCKNCTLPEHGCTKGCRKEPCKPRKDACEVCGVKSCCGPLCACKKECQCGVGGRAGSFTFGTVHEVCPTAHGLKVMWVEECSFAHKLGVKAGDILVDIGGVQIRSRVEIIMLARDSLKKHGRISVKVLRGCEEIILAYGHK